MKIAVIIRQLAGHPPVAHAVIHEPSEMCSDFNVELYFEAEAEERITQFKKQYVEFEKADWYVNILDVPDIK